MRKKLALTPIVGVVALGLALVPVLVGGSWDILLLFVLPILTMGIWVGLTLFGPHFNRRQLKLDRQADLSDLSKD